MKDDRQSLQLKLRGLSMLIYSLSDLKKFKERSVTSSVADPGLFSHLDPGKKPVSDPDP